MPAPRMRRLLAQPTWSAPARILRRKASPTPSNTSRITTTTTTSVMVRPLRIMLISRGFAADALVGGAQVGSRSRIDQDGMGVSLFCPNQPVPHPSQSLDHGGIILHPLEANLVGKPLVVQARGGHRFVDRHV